MVFDRANRDCAIEENPAGISASWLVAPSEQQRNVSGELRPTKIALVVQK
jgi:hypothetical protein